MVGGGVGGVDVGGYVWVGVGVGGRCGGRGGSRDRREVWWQGWE